MSNEDTNVTTDVTVEEVKTSSPVSSEPPKNSLPDGVNRRVGPETQLVQRRPFTSDPDKNTDAKEDTSPATLDVGDLQNVTLGHLNKIDILKDENGLGKGVLLNATQLYPAGWVPDTLGNDKAKDHELKQSYLVAGNHVFEASMEKNEQLPEAKDGQMSLTRKILFGASFLPSILFVLCFAIILPCQEPNSVSLCEKVLWSAVFNETDLPADFALTSEALLISSLERNDKLISLNVETGDELWTTLLKSSVIKIECHSFDADKDDIYDCLVLTKDRFLYAFNASNGYVFWNHTIPGDEPPNFAILPDCDNDGIPEIAVAVSSSEIQIISNGSPRLPVILSRCNTVPEKLTAWVNRGETNLIYTCQTNSNHGSLAYIKQEKWCSKEKGLKTQTNELLNSFRDQVDFENMLLKPTSDGLIVWANDFLAFFGNDGKELWQTFALNHAKNRYLFYGNFTTKKHIILISGDFAPHSLVTLIDASSGNETFSYLFKEASVENGVLLNGKEKDSILVLLKEVPEEKQNASLTETTFNLNLPTTVMDIELLNLPKPIEPKHKLVVLQFQIKDSSISLQEKYVRSEVIPHKERSTSLTARVDENDLRIYLGQTQLDGAGYVSSTIQAFQVNNWDQTEIPQCR